MRRLTFGGRDGVPIWSLDGRDVFFSSDRDGKPGIYRQIADGTGSAERLTETAEGDFGHIPSSVDPKGKTLAFEVRHTPSFADSDIWILPWGTGGKPRPFLQMPGFQGHAVFSPDGKWLAYMSNELRSARQVFVQPYPSTGAKYQITTDGGDDPIWSPDGSQLFYSSNSKLFAVDVRTQPGFSFGKPQPLPISGFLQRLGQPPDYDITPDGKQFLVVLPASQNETNQRSTAQIDIVLNWFEELKQRVPVK